MLKLNASVYFNKEKIGKLNSHIMHSRNMASARVHASVLKMFMLSDVAVRVQRLLIYWRFLHPQNLCLLTSKHTTPCPATHR